MNKLVLLAAVLAPSIAAAQPAGYYNQPQSPWQFHNGLTFEGNLGFGGMWSRATYSNGDSSTSDTQASIGANFGIGGFLNPQLALTFRFASVNFTEDYPDGLGGTITYSAIFMGPSVQYWLNPDVWIGGGIGFAVAHAQYNNDYGDVGDSNNDPTGLALDLRGGFTFWRSFRNSLNVSAEYTPGFYGEENGVKQQLNGFAVLFGYQYL